MMFPLHTLEALMRAREGKRAKSEAFLGVVDHRPGRACPALSLDRPLEERKTHGSSNREVLWSVL